MKKIFYFIASAIVALGAMACQNEVDENITPENTNEISFTVSFDESTRVEGTVDDKNKTASFEIDGSEILTIGDVKLSYDEDKGVFVATSDKDKATLNGLIGKPVTATIEDVYNSLKFASAEFELAQENNITVSLACPALYFTVPADTEVDLTVNEKFIATYPNGDYFLGIEGPTAAISYSVNNIPAKYATIDVPQSKVYNLGILNAPTASTTWKVMGNGDWATGATMYVAANNINLAIITTEAADTEIKFKKGNTWYGGTCTLDSWSSISTSGNNMKIAEAGTYYCYVTDDNKCYISTKKDILTYVGLIGSFEGSNWSTDVPMYLKGDWFEATVTVAKDAQYKIRKYGDWNSAHGYGTGDGWISAGSDLIQAGSDGNFQIKAAGTYKISINKTFSSTKIEKIK